MSDFGVKLPDVGEGVAEAEVVAWMVEIGDSVTADQPLAEVMTDKASVEIYAPVAGTVSALNGQPGDFIAVGSDLLTLVVEATVAEAAEVGSAQPNPVTPRAQTPTAASTIIQARTIQPPESSVGKPVARTRGARPLASPAVRKRARDNWVNLVEVSGSGPAGRISQADLDAFLAGGRSATPISNGQPAAPDTLFSAIPDASSEEVRVIGLRRRIAQQMAESKRRIPHFSYVEEIDVTQLEAYRTLQNAQSDADAPKLTVLPYLITALAVAIKEHPEMNARFDDAAGVIHRYENLYCGVAAQTPKGLMVPVIRNAEQLNVSELATEVARLGNGARDGSLEASELRGASITISSLGPLGGVVTTPVINHPEVAIIGVNKIVERPVVVDGEIVIRKMMNLSGSFDHRAVDGMDAAMFIQRIKVALENVGSDDD